MKSDKKERHTRRCTVNQENCTTDGVPKQEKNNKEIRNFIKNYGLKNAEAAAAIGYSETHFCRLLREELPATKKAEIAVAIMNNCERKPKKETRENTMAAKKNLDIRKMANDNGVHLWEIAEELGILDTAFSRMLRHELPDEKKAEICRAIGRIDSRNRSKGETTWQ